MHSWLAWRGWSWPPTGTTRWPRSGCPGARCTSCPRRPSTPTRRGERIAARREKLEGEIERLEKKLANERFIERAPAEVVQAERDKLAEYRAALEAARA